MSDSKNSYKNLTIIFLLGISSGLPLALILSTLKASLLEQGFDLKTIGFFSLISLPYSFKFLFAPIIDSSPVPFLTKIFGQRKSWIIFSQGLLALFIALLGTAQISSNLGAIAVFSLLVAFASASQDVVIDGYRIELIEKENQGLAASFAVYGYRVGMLISGACALALAEFFSWDVVYFAMACCMIFAMTITAFAEETRKNFAPKKTDFLSWLKNSAIAPLLDFTSHKGWLAILTFIIFFKLADAFAGNLTLPFLLQIGFSKIEIAAIVKTFGLFATLFGVFVGGLLVKKIGIRNALWVAAFAQMFSNFAFCYLAKVGHDSTALYVVIFIENFSGGIGDSIFVAYLSGLCNLQFSATQYALLSSLATMARSLLSSSAGLAAELLGWFDFFIFSAFLALPGILLLLIITKISTRSSLQT